MCTVLLPPGVNPTAVNKYIISVMKLIIIIVIVIITIMNIETALQLPRIATTEKLQHYTP